MQSVYLLHYGELALKGGNRRMFEEKLAENVRLACAPIGKVRIKRLYGRLVLRPAEDDLDLDQVAQRLANVFGLAHYSSALMADATWDNLLELSDTILPSGQHSFGVRCKKADETWTKGKTETARDLGAHIVATRDWPVDLTNPDIWLRVDVVNGKVIVSAQRKPGRKGLPVGVSGRVMTLLSGGIDSPVAAYRMMSRGCAVDGIHFHSAPYTSRASQDKVVELAEALLRYQPKFQLTVVPFASVQQEIVQKTPQQYRVILYRRFMMRIADAVARRRKIATLVTGESVGQVASQTLTNMHTVQTATNLTIMRPLVGVDKEQITTWAREAGTYEISIQPHEDCCSFLMPRKPATRSQPYELDDVEKALDVEGLVQSALEQVETIALD